MQEIEINKKIETFNYINTPRKRLIYDCSKRGFDIISSLIAIIIFSPILVTIIFLVKFDSKGPAVFGHTRIGRNGIKIRVYKFRTMVENAQEILDNFSKEQKKEFEKNFKLENDPRITRIGKFLRETSLDELPQLFNILIGSMTVVGPRPIVEKEIEKYGIYGEKLLSVKPGLTGLWQASGRSDTTYEERVIMDMEYIDKRSFCCDIWIIFKTIGAVFKREGAK